jgi:hypothetical protein
VALCLEHVLESILSNLPCWSRLGQLLVCASIGAGWLRTSRQTRASTLASTIFQSAVTHTAFGTLISWLWCAG